MTSTEHPVFVSLPEEQRELIAAVNGVVAPVPAGTLDSLGAAAVVAGPHEVALRDLWDVVTRGRFWDHVVDLAGQLSAAGVKPGDRVLLDVAAGWEQFAAAVAVLRAGCVCVPLPPPGAGTDAGRRAAPTGSGATVVVTQRGLSGRPTWPSEVTVLTPRRDPPAAAASVDPPASDGSRAAFLLPRPAPAGTVAAWLGYSHRVLLNALTEVNRRVGLGVADRVLALAPAESGTWLHETFGALLAGASVVCAAENHRHDPGSWLAQGRRDGVTVCFLTTAMLDDLLAHLARTGDPLPETLRAVVVHGGWLAPGRVVELWEAAGRGLTVLYATAPVWPGPLTVLYDVATVADDWRSVPVGAPVANQRLYVLSEARNPCPVWVTGRLYAGGLLGEPVPAVSGGTVTHPETGEALLPTDLFGRLRPDGLVEVVGDETTQLAARGGTVNLRDTEVALHTHPAVRQAVVVVSAVDGRAAAFVRPRDGVVLSAADLNTYLRTRVSPFLLPARTEIVGALPLTRDGRVDRVALAAGPDVVVPLVVTPPTPTPAAPSGDRTTELMLRVTAVASRIFDVADIEPDANLMDLGASSMQLVRLASVVEEEAGIAVDVEELLAFPTIAVIVGSHLATESPAPAPDTVRPVGAARDDLDHRPVVDLGGVADERIGRRRTSRAFAAQPVSLAALGALLGATRSIRSRGAEKFWYPSAGGSYPVQVYLLVTPGGVTGLAAGSYYYHPRQDRLIVLDPAGALPAAAHREINRAAFRQSAFSLYLVGRMSAISKTDYADLAWDFTVFEAGAMTQLLGQVAAEHGLGLCPVGAMDTDPLPDLFALGAQDRFVHALLGGVPLGTA
ncbi:SagB-type dehydrogenase domain-containing protein [Micromonospora haikouensis]|uniref:SagB-type dehydrogenase domain-containing protein n=1 Tax=Micromonospora haikouensis TaxID=686309 RepID=A0A1C4XGR6_9ACTN|nr:AMP-binding protein [Micromonospora haikouensis]SCF07759.1 SagB-type dehydrogenase domain-containing protein [Micromonospora haikouensis]